MCSAKKDIPKIDGVLTWLEVNADIPKHELLVATGIYKPVARLAHPKNVPALPASDVSLCQRAAILWKKWRQLLATREEVIAEMSSSEKEESNEDTFSDLNSDYWKIESDI
ncbi:hypothetical protein BDZ89DRAFT_1043154 [Hymenopellis radicata]|nr:hypothetical protein BDZ89DRAFT_1043154 [Hymenopellis radicata]